MANHPISPGSMEGGALLLTHCERTGILEDSIMRLRAMGLIVTFALSMLVGPLAVAAQQPAKIPRIGMLLGGSPDWTAPTLEAFRQRLHELGYVEGHTITIDY